MQYVTTSYNIVFFVQSVNKTFVSSDHGCCSNCIHVFAVFPNFKNLKDTTVARTYLFSHNMLPDRAKEQFDPSKNNDSVTRVTSRNDGESTRITFFTELLDSTRVTISDSSQSCFYKTSKHLIDKPSLFAHKQLAFLASVMMNISVHFLFWLCLLVVLCCILRINCSTHRCTGVHFLRMQKIFGQIWSCFSQTMHKQQVLMLRPKRTIVNKSRCLHA